MESVRPSRARVKPSPKPAPIQVAFPPTSSLDDRHSFAPAEGTPADSWPAWADAPLAAVAAALAIAADEHGGHR